MGDANLRGGSLGQGARPVILRPSTLRHENDARQRDGPPPLTTLQVCFIIGIFSYLAKIGLPPFEPATVIAKCGFEEAEVELATGCTVLRAHAGGCPLSCVVVSKLPPQMDTIAPTAQVVDGAYCNTLHTCPGTKTALAGNVAQPTVCADRPISE